MPKAVSGPGVDAIVSILLILLLGCFIGIIAQVAAVATDAYGGILVILLSLIPVAAFRARYEHNSRLRSHQK